jgi:AcrR family transcriptional regulator
VDRHPREVTVSEEAPVSEDRPYHHGDLPAALLRAVAELIDEGGLEAVTLRAAARRAGVSHAAPAHHFGDKHGLLAAFASEGFAAFSAELAAARDATDGTPAERLGAMALAYLDFAREHRAWFEVMFRPELVGEHHHELAVDGSGSFQLLVAQVAACLDPSAPDDDVLQLAVAAWATVHGLAHLSVDGPLEVVAPEGDVLAALGTFLAGLRTHPQWIGDSGPA